MTKILSKSQKRDLLSKKGINKLVSTNLILNLRS